jgi:hypothetical protein
MLQYNKLICRSAITTSEWQTLQLQSTMPVFHIVINTDVTYSRPSSRHRFSARIGQLTYSLNKPVKLPVAPGNAVIAPTDILHRSTLITAATQLIATIRTLDEITSAAPYTGAGQFIGQSTTCWSAAVP